MLGILLAIATAFFKSVEEVIAKRSLRDIDEYVVGWFARFLSLVLLVPYLLFTGIPEIGPSFLPAVLLATATSAIGTILTLKAIKHSDLSLVSPMLAFTPLFMLLTSPLMIGEFPPLAGLAGVLLIVLGSLFLNPGNGRSPLGSLRNLLSEKGPRYMLIVAFVYSIGANLDKIAVSNSSPAMYLVVVNLTVSLVLLPMMIRRKSSVQCLRGSLPFLILIGLVTGTYLITQMTAITMTMVVYVTSIKRTSALMSVLLGGLLFREKDIRRRFLAALLMIMGVVFITLF